MDFRLVTDIRGEWPRIKRHLEAVQAKCPEDWICEDVYHALKSGTAACHLTEGGMMVTTLTQTDYSGLPVLHVWVGHHETHDPIGDETCEFLRHLARNAGATRITFGSPRLGWSKRFPLVSAVYEVPLDVVR